MPDWAIVREPQEENTVMTAMGRSTYVTRIRRSGADDRRAMCETSEARMTAQERKQTLASQIREKINGNVRHDNNQSAA